MEQEAIPPESTTPVSRAPMKEDIQEENLKIFDDLGFSSILKRSAWLPDVEDGCWVSVCMSSFSLLSFYVYMREKKERYDASLSQKFFFYTQFEGVFARENEDIPADDDKTPHTAVGTILEVEPVDPLLEVSHLTDDSKLFQTLLSSLPPKVERRTTIAYTPPQAEQDVLFVARQPSGVSSFSSKPTTTSMVPRFETPERTLKTLVITGTGTPETLPLEDDDGESDEKSDDSKFQRPKKSEATIQVDDYKEITFSRMVDRLRGNTEIRRIQISRLSRMRNQRNRTDEEMSSLFDVLHTLPNLYKVVLRSFSQFDLELIGSFVKKHKSLERLHIHLVSGTADAAFLEHLAQSTSLREVSIDVQRSFPLHLLLSSKSLKHLIVPSERFYFDEDQLVFAMAALEKNSTLKVLDMKPKLTAADLRLLSFGIRRNSTLKILRFSFLADDNNSGPSLLHFSNALAYNSTLQTVQNHYRGLLSLSPVDSRRVLQVIENHSTLKDCSIFKVEQTVKEREDPIHQDKESFLARIMCHSDLSSLCRFPDSVSKFWQTNNNSSSDRETKDATMTKITTSISQMHNHLQQSFAKMMSFRSK